VLANTHDGKTVVNELRETNPKLISLAKLNSWLLSAIFLKAVNVARLIFYSSKNIKLTLIVKNFGHNLISLDGKELKAPYKFFQTLKLLMGNTNSVIKYYAKTLNSQLKGAR